MQTIQKAGILTAVMALVISGQCLSWGPEGHRAVGTLALWLADEKASGKIESLLESDGADAIGAACFWPDTVRKTAAWEWSAPQHYVNIPRHATQYECERDCPDGLCVVEAIKKYAAQLMDERLGQAERRQSFAWLCHLVGDIHQPLHAGYRDDRGANRVDVIFQGKRVNLHQFWDQALIRDRLGAHPDGWPLPESDGDWRFVAGNWSPDSVDTWADEAHALVASEVYPGIETIDQEFADRGWLLIRQQWLKAGNRLAQILNATLGNGFVELDGRERVCVTDDERNMDDRVRLSD